MSRLTFLFLWSILALVLAACDEEAPPGDDDTSADDDDDDDDTDLPGDHDFTAVVETADGEPGTVVLEFTPAWSGGTVRRFEAEVGANITIDGLAHGPYGLLAWLDVDGDGAWDGVWEGDGEPTARLGLEIPRQDLQLVVRRGVPTPVLSDDPQWVDLYFAAWELAEDHVAAGTAANGFADHYLDEAFSEQIFQWDTCFMTLFGRFGTDSFPTMASLDNFYGTQFNDGYICRVVNESDGLAGGDASDPSEPMINPPLFAWSELLYVRQTGDLSRLPDVVGVLDAYHDWIDDNVRTEPDLYYTSMLGSGMDNAPRDEAFDGWVDITAQQALARDAQADLAELLGSSTMAEDCREERDRICADVRDQMWDDDEGFFFDLDEDGSPLTHKTLASVWPLVAGCATDDQAARTVAHLADPAEFWRVHVFPSTAADSEHYDPAGFYWRGGVWAPTNYATMNALVSAGRRDLARDAAENHLQALHRVLTDFVPAEGQLSEEAIGDGTGTLWELYAPDAFAPGTRWDETYLGRQDFVGWSGLGPIAGLLEWVIGLEADAVDDTLTWHLDRTDEHGVLGYRFGDQLVDLVAQPRDATDAPVTLDVETTDAFTLVVWMGGRSWTLDVPRGSSTHDLDPTDTPLAVDTVPAGPFPGYAVLGNGSISAVWSDDDGSGDPPGITHLYRGDFGLDLAVGGRTRVLEGGEIRSGARVGLDPFFATYSELPLACGGTLHWRAFVGEDDAVVVLGSLAAGADACDVRVVPHVTLRESPHIDGTVSLTSAEAVDSILRADFTDGSGVALAAHPQHAAWQIGTVDTGTLADGLPSTAEGGHDLAVQLDLSAAAGAEQAFRWVLAVGDGGEDAAEIAQARLDATDPLADAAAHWDDWSPQALCGADDPCRIAAANLYAARSSSLNGSVPADLTGQFVTNDFPQLYPRDALMVARALELTGHPDEAWEIVLDWLDSDRDGPQPGEWYARYDAVGRAVDGGTGAAFDVPEWDCNGYLAMLVERLGPQMLDATQRETLLLAMDTLVSLQDDDGLFFEGGIVEWEGRLPATAMTSWAGLDAAARLADAWGEPDRAADYRDAAGRIRGGLWLLYDFDRMLLADERDGGLAYDTSMLFGPAWGFPADPRLDSSLDWILDNATAHGGGVRYFDGMGYGQDLFYFTTSATAQYASTLGDTEAAGDLIDWMRSFSNRYGLAPERVYTDGSGAAEASPLSWCAAEVAVAVLARLDAEGIATLPAVDGVVDPAEYRPWGASAVDSDGAPDVDHDAVALFAAQGGTDLVLGLWLAGDPAGLDSSASYAFYLSGEDGTGAETETEEGQRLTFATPGADVPGAAARVRITPATGDCVAGAADGGGYDDQPCAAAAVGERALEAQVDLSALGIIGAVQVIAAAEGSAGDALLPPHGALTTAPANAGVAVTFEVDAASVAGQLDPDAGVVVTLSGDRAELGAWAGHAVGLTDDGVWPDLAADDEIWTTVVHLSDRGHVAYKYLVGTVGDPSWDGVEFEGDDRGLWVQDADGSGRVLVADTFGEPYGALQDP